MTDLDKLRGFAQAILALLLLIPALSASPIFETRFISDTHLLADMLGPQINGHFHIPIPPPVLMPAPLPADLPVIVGGYPSPGIPWPIQAPPRGDVPEPGSAIEVLTGGLVMALLFFLVWRKR